MFTTGWVVPEVPACTSAPGSAERLVTMPSKGATMLIYPRNALIRATSAFPSSTFCRAAASALAVVASRIREVSTSCCATNLG